MDVKAPSGVAQGTNGGPRSGLQGLARYSGSVIDFISIALGSTGAVLLVVTSLLVTIEVIMRHYFSSSLSWTFDLSIYFVLAAMFFAAAYAAKENAHICVDFITSALSRRTQTLLEVVTFTWTSFFCANLTVSAIQMAYVSASRQILDDTLLALPLVIPQSAFALGALVLTLQITKITILKYRDVFQPKPENNEPKLHTFMTPVDKAKILLPAVLILVVASTVLFSLGGNLRTIGLVLMLATVLATGTPVFAAIGIVGCIGLVFLLGGGFTSQGQVGILAYKQLNSFVIGAIPLYIIGAGILSMGGLGQKLYEVCRKWFPPIRGKLGIATIAACAFFAAISGSSIASAAAFSIIAVPAMLALGYDKKLAYGTVAGGGTLAILIPPSGTFILYGFLTGESVGKLFMAGVIPGIMVTLFFILYIYFKCRKDVRYDKDIITNYSWSERFTSLKDAIWILIAPVFILGAIYTGICTPTEAAAITVVYAILVTVFIGNTGRRNLWKTLRESTKTGSMVLMILAGSTIFGAVLTYTKIPQEFVNFSVTANIPPWAIIILINILLLILGMFMEGVAITMISIPIIYPAIKALGLDPIWFGVIFVINMEVGLISPPVGMNLYAMRGATGGKLSEITRGALPFLLILLGSMIVIGVLPQVATWLPSTMHIGK